MVASSAIPRTPPAGEPPAARASHPHTGSDAVRRKSAPRPVKDLYKALGAPVGASRQRIDELYRARKAGVTDGLVLWELKRAYVTLTDPARRAQYDKALKHAEVPPRVPRKLALGLALAGLMATLAFVTVPYFAWQFTTHSSGVELRTLQGAPFGRVLVFEPYHTFGNGITGAAYRVLMYDSGREIWLPKADVNRRAKAI